MPLAARDVNIRSPAVNARGRSRNLHRDDSYLSLEHDENTSPPPRKVSTPSHNVLAPTRASAARIGASAPPARRMPTPPVATPTLSRLPRRGPSPHSAPPPAGHRPALFTARSASAGRAPRTLRANTPDHNITPCARLDEEQNNSSSAQPSGIPKPLFYDKPLPSRPIASFVSNVSPSKDGRTLLDASDKPLQVSIGGSCHEWPAITPRSVSAPERTSNSSCKTPRSSIPTRTSGSTGLAAAAGELTNVINGRDPRDSKISSGSRACSTPSFVSASESKLDEAQYEQSVEQASSSPTVGSNAHDSAAKRNAENGSDTPHKNTSTFPVRKQSLFGHNYNNNIAQSKRESVDISGDSVQPGSLPPHARLHSPSPASFSRPRPESGSCGTRTPSLCLSTPDRSVRHHRTASRLPIPDSKKATLVEIAQQRPPGLTGSTQDKGPSFGSRRLVSPGALAVLDQGTKRRQLQRANTNESSGSNASARTKIGPANDRGTATNNEGSPEGTAGRSSSDEDEPITPSPTTSLKQHDLKSKPSFSNLQSNCLNRPPDFWQEAEPTGRRPPPSNSPFTVPLETIPSQAILPNHGPTNEQTGNVEAPTFPNIVNCLSDLRWEPSARSTPEFETPEDFQDVIERDFETDKIECPAHERTDALNMEAKSHLRRTLCLLEGQGTPPETDIDEDKLRLMLNRVGLPNTSRDSSSLYDKLVVAENFLSQKHQPSTYDDAGRLADASLLTRGLAEGPEKQTTSKTGTGDPSIETIQVASKWSDSTPSAQGHSTTTSGAATSESRPMDSRRGRNDLAATANPSRIPSITTARTSVDKASRTSSPTLGIGALKGKRAPGSVRAARKRLPPSSSSYARPTAVADSKKTARSPNPESKPTKSISSAHQEHRCPVEDMRRSRMDFPSSEDAKAPRSRSKSRLVFDKVAGFLSGKRDKQMPHSPPPPMPKISTVGNVPEIKPLQVGRSSSVPKLRPFSSRMSVSEKTHIASPSVQAAVEHESTATIADHEDLPNTSRTNSPHNENDATQVLTLTEKLKHRAEKERSVQRKERLLQFANVLLESQIHAKEARISAEEAKQAADRAAKCVDITVKGLAMLNRLARSIVEGPARCV